MRKRKIKFKKLHAKNLNKKCTHFNKICNALKLSSKIVWCFRILFHILRKKVFACKKLMVMTSVSLLWIILITQHLQLINKKDAALSFATTFITWFWKSDCQGLTVSIILVRYGVVGYYSPFYSITLTIGSLGHLSTKFVP